MPERALIANLTQRSGTSITRTRVHSIITTHNRIFGTKSMLPRTNLHLLHHNGYNRTVESCRKQCVSARLIHSRSHTHNTRKAQPFNRTSRGAAHWATRAKIRAHKSSLRVCAFMH